MPDTTDNPIDVVVLGAGIVGVSAAYAARQRGLSVVLVDPRPRQRDLLCARRRMKFRRFIPARAGSAPKYADLLPGRALLR